MEQNLNPQGSSKGLSIAALICGVLGIVGYFLSYGSLSAVDTSAETLNVTGPVIIGILGLILGIVGIILGAIGMKKAKANGESKGLALAGLICGIVGTVFGFISVLCVAGVACAANSLVNQLNNYNY